MKTGPLILALLLAAAPAWAVELSGTLDMRTVLSDGRDSWSRAGLGKLRYDRHNQGLRVGQAVLRLDGELSDTVSATAIASADDQRSGVIDLNEAWLRWNPVPRGPWKASVRAGAFFPHLSLENDGVGWTPTRSASTSAINSWVGEELRTVGIELNLTRRGRPLGSEHDFGFTAAIHKANDPTGTLLTWRGWSISDRITGLSEALLLPELPVYRPDGPIRRQSRTIHVFRELDGRLGYQAAAHYGYRGWLELSAMKYDNRADPRVFHDGQYGWRTRFQHLAAKVRQGEWEWLFQGMRGDTYMGRRAAGVDMQAWYLMGSRRMGAHRVSLRYDHFSAVDNDVIPADPNGERGRAVALAWTWQHSPAWSVLAEALVVDSVREARALGGAASRQTERSLTTALRYHF
ncbi:MAG: hypothetical protein V4723_11445 [Pseudomonadota bacterium]